MQTRITLHGVIGLLLFVCPQTSALSQGLDRVDQNVKIMVEAARRLTTLDPPGTRPQVLVKQEVVAAPVAVIFGYGDNREACENIAKVLSASGVSGTFRCSDIY